MSSSLAIFFFLFLISTSSSNAQRIPCNIPFRLFTQQNNLTNCRKLPTLEAELAWELIPQNRSRFHVIFGARLSDDVAWVAWGVNPSHPQMAGTRAMIAVRDIETGVFRVAAYNVTSKTRKRCGLLPNQELEVEFGNSSMEYVNGIDYYAMRATVGFPAGSYDVSRLNHVWQVGYRAEGMEPRIHPVSNLQHFDSTETIDLRTGLVHQRAGQHRRYLRNVHGILSIIGWGTILPMGGIIARYSRFPLEVRYPRWFFAHRCCQLVGYSLGTAGWIVGIFVGNSTKLYVMKIHRLYAIFIFAFATLQVTALFFKPGKGDEYRKYWNLYHHFLGYGLLSVIIINMFKGIAILKPNYTWKWGYIGILSCLAALALAMEIWSWIKFLHIRKLQRNHHHHHHHHHVPIVTDGNTSTPWRSNSVIPQPSTVVGPDLTPTPSSSTLTA
ncbi:Cytochrome b561 and DOMON domain-containing protein At4g12980 [Linum grandiflorum]